jgi:hypothetical protein
MSEIGFGEGREGTHRRGESETVALKKFGIVGDDFHFLTRESPLFPFELAVICKTHY